MQVIGWIKEKAARIAERLKEPISLKAKLLMLSVILTFLSVSAYIAYRVYDYTQNNPNFCVGCHLMQPAFDTWALSEHKGLNCHDCHHLSVPELNQLLISFVFKRPTVVPERHKEHVIVKQKYCNQCHTEGKAPRINRSLFHAKHVYMEQIECTQCHGETKTDKSGLHRFLPTEKFCLKCHPDRQVHGEGMGGLACLNCHTDRTADLKPERSKCLYCHGSDEAVRKRLLEDATIDVRFFTPTADMIKNAKKIVMHEKSPMQFNCSECHKPHTPGKVRPKSGDCLRCHDNMAKRGKHQVHLAMDMQCKDCHKPHVWKVTEASAKKDCVTCHEYRSPSSIH